MTPYDLTLNELWDRLKTDDKFVMKIGGTFWTYHVPMFTSRSWRQVDEVLKLLGDKLND